jgi:hypothetical protein
LHRDNGKQKLDANLKVFFVAIGKKRKAKAIMN